MEAMRCHIFVWGQVRVNNFCGEIRGLIVIQLSDGRRQEIVIHDK